MKRLIIDIYDLYTDRHVTQLDRWVDIDDGGFSQAIAEWAKDNGYPVDCLHVEWDVARNDERKNDAASPRD